MLITGAGTAKHISQGNLVLICLNKNSSIISLQGTSLYHVPHVQHSFAPRAMLPKSMPIPTFVSAIPLQMCITYKYLSKGAVILN